jgi:UDP-N-acetylmuramate dehydrogenase
MQKPNFIQHDVLLAPYTTYLVGGPAKYFSAPANYGELAEILKWCKISQTPYFIIGKGSNLIVSDSGYNGLVLSLEHFNQIDSVGYKVTCGAGALLWDVVHFSVEKRLAGMQNLIGIPGTIGGGVFINAGAFDQDLSQTLYSVTSMNRDGKVITRLAHECELSYRYSAFFRFNEIILSATFELKYGNPTLILNQMNETWKKRQARQPLEYPNAGSMFKRPEGTFAGKLIEEANLKGFQLRGAQISPKHANFVINSNHAKAQDIFDLSEEVIEKVYQNSGIRLEREQILVGNFVWRSNV